MMLCVVPLSAQKTSMNFGPAEKPPLMIARNSKFDAYVSADEEMCFPWKRPAERSRTVSVARLKVPSKARDEYDKACDAFQKGSLDQAEQHARDAIRKSQGYPAAWVMLGLVLEQQHRSEEAREACSHAAKIEAKYLPAYLCAAEISVRKRAWEQALNSAEMALALSPEPDPYAYYYRAKAYLYTNQVAEAKKSALQALQLEVNHDEPSLFLLLAQIYAREGDTADAIAQLKEFLKCPTDPQHESAAKQFLADLESQVAAK
jgi:tetratricopeptide (TPR) repeat protein